LKITEVIEARGHRNVQSTHKTTLEITKETTLTRRGNCIVAIAATKGAADLNTKFKNAARKEGAKITVTIRADDLTEIVRASGSPQLPFTDPMDLVVRKSKYICGRTIAVKADKAANDLSRKLVEKMRDPFQEVKITLQIENY
jgi:hypothetical protein